MTPQDPHDPNAPPEPPAPPAPFVLLHPNDISFIYKSAPAKKPVNKLPHCRYIYLSFIEPIPLLLN